MASGQICFPADTGSMYSIPYDTIEVISEGAPTQSGQERTVIQYVQTVDSNEAQQFPGLQKIQKVLTALMSYSDIIEKTKKAAVYPGVW